MIFFFIHYRAIQSMLMITKGVEEEAEQSMANNDLSRDNEILHEDSTSILPISFSHDQDSSDNMEDENVEQKKTEIEEILDKPTQSVKRILETIESDSGNELEGGRMENWGGLGKRSKYFGIPTPEIMQIREGTKIKIPLLQNGNHQNLAIAVKGKEYRVVNTCPFDALIQCFASAHCDSVRFGSNTENWSDSSFFNFLIFFLKNGNKRSTYKLRCEVLEQHKIIFKENGKNGVFIIDVNCNITNIASQFLKNYPCAIGRYLCDNCADLVTTRNSYFLPVRIQDLESKGFEFLYDSIDFNPHGSSNSKCPNCNNVLKIQRTFADYLLIDSDIGIGTSIDLKKIQLNFNVGDKNYILRALANFIAPPSEDATKINKNAIGHYNSYCRRKDGQWEVYDDLLKEYNVVRNDIMVNPHMLLYTV